MVKLIAVALALIFAVGCTHVAPYERGRLAHPSMTTGGRGAGESHVYAVHEGTTGGGEVAESGCGCN